MNRYPKATVEVGDPQDIRDNKLMAVLAYLVFFLPLLVCPQSRFARYHANQSLILFIILCGVGIISRFFSIIPLLGVLFLAIRWLLSLVVLVFMILGMINAWSGKMKPLPLIGGIRILK